MLLRPICNMQNIVVNSLSKVKLNLSGINQMWILKKSIELLNNFKAQTLLEVNNIKTFDFPTLYTTIPHGNLKSKLKEIILL